MSTDHERSESASTGFSSGVYVGDVELAVRTKSRFSRTAHVPATDAAGAPIFDDDGFPKTKCDVEAGQDDLKRKLVPVHTVSNRRACTNCSASKAEIAERNKKGAGKKSWARKMRFGDGWGSTSD